MANGGSLVLSARGLKDANPLLFAGPRNNEREFLTPLFTVATDATGFATQPKCCPFRNKILYRKGQHLDASDPQAARRALTYV